MAKSSKAKPAAQYEAGTLAAYACLGIIFIVLGLVTLLAVLGGVQGAMFDFVRRVMQGLGGGLSFFISVLLVWLGVLVAFSSWRSMPKRGFLLMTVLYLAVLAMIDLLSGVGQYSLMEYLQRWGNMQSPPVAEPDGFVNMLKAAYDVCGTNCAFGGMLGMLLAWPAWKYLGVTLGTVLLGIVCLACVLLFTRFDMRRLFEGIRDGFASMRQSREQRRAQAEQRRLEEEQRRQAEKDERLRRTPAYKRRGAAQPDQQPVPAAPAAVQQPMPVAPPVGAGYTPFAPRQQTAVYYTDENGVLQPVPQNELYDELVVSQENMPKWTKPSKKADKQKQPTPVPNAYQTSMTFTPAEVGMPVEEEPLADTLPLPASKRKALEKIESIRKRKTESPSAEPAAQPTQAIEPMQPAAAAIYSPVTDEPNAAPDRNAAYKRPDQPAAAVPQPKPAAEKTAYVYPSIDLLNTRTQRAAVDTRATDAEDAARLEKTLDSFSIPARVQRVTHGPAVTRFELGLVSSGVNVKRILSIADNIALDMAANGGVRIEIPIPGTNLFGIEVPNKEIQSVSLSEVLLSPEMQAAKSPLAVALGRDIAGRAVICDLAKMPHLLIAGQTGSGKSVCINAIINSILFRSSPEEVRMIMIDPKVVELQCYNVVPHLLIPVVSDPHKAAGALQWAVAEMLDRYHKMQSKNVRELSAYNAKLGPDEEKLPRIVIVIDELADLMLACKKEVEESIIRIAQLARAAGIHMVVATQRPTVDVITGLIKANIPSRIAFAVSSSIDSRTILDQNGAEKLLGRGDMFYFPTGASAPMRVQGCFLSDAETERVVEYIGQHSHVDFDPNVIEAMESEDESANLLADSEDNGVDDRLVEAIELVFEAEQASISMLQRRMKIGYARAGRMIDAMAVRGIVSKAAGSKPREVLMSREEFESIKSTLM